MAAKTCEITVVGLYKAKFNYIKTEKYFSDALDDTVTKKHRAQEETFIAMTDDGKYADVGYLVIPDTPLPTTIKVKESQLKTSPREALDAKKEMKKKGLVDSVSLASGRRGAMTDKLGYIIQDKYDAKVKSLVESKDKAKITAIERGWDAFWVQEAAREARHILFERGEW